MAREKFGRAGASLFVLLVATLGFARLSADDKWPQFRGLKAGLADDDPALPETWSETENVAWKISIPGQSWSSPVVWGDHIFVTSAISSSVEPTPEKGIADPTPEAGRMKSTSPHRWVVYDFDFKTGSIRWERELRSGAPAINRHVRNSYASETPATDGERVYVYFGSVGIVAALDFSGAMVWSRDAGVFESGLGWGMAASPLLYQGRLIIVNDNRMESFIAAFDAKTGAPLWRVPREEFEGWSTPVIWQNEMRTEIVTAGARRVRSYDLDGKQLWELSGMSDFGSIPTPVVRGDLVYVSSGYPGSARRPVFAIRAGGSGDISLKPEETSNQHIAWFQPLLGSYQTSGLAYGDYYYTLLDRGFLLCHDAKTGKQIYGRQRIAPDVSGFSSSPWAYNGRIFVASEDGDTYVIEAGPQYKLLAKNSLNEMIMATPAVAQGSVIVRTQSKLYRIAKAPRR
jgi:outer membrane protein assembly factor BamB